MKKRLAIIAALILGVISIHAATMTPEQASLAVQGWIKSDPVRLDDALGDRTVASVIEGKNSLDETVYYAVQLSPEGYVIVSTNDSIEPIIAFSPAGAFEPSPGNPLADLAANDLSGRLAVANNTPPKDFATMASGATAASRWSSYISAANLPAKEYKQATISDVRVAPLLSSKWGQTTSGGNSCYNYFTPTNDTPTWTSGNSSNYPCGCVATAMAQFMRYHEFPAAGVGSGIYRAVTVGASPTVASVAQWDMDADPTTDNTSYDAGVLSAASNITASTVGLTTDQTGTGLVATGGWSTTAGYYPDRYIQLTATVKAGNDQVVFNTLRVSFSRDANGPQDVLLGFSTDGANFTVYNVGGTVTTSVVTKDLTFGDQVADPGDTFYVRLYGRSALDGDTGVLTFHNTGDGGGPIYLMATESYSRELRGGDGSGGAYDWADMPLDPSSGSTAAQREKIGALTYDAGLSVHMNYTSTGSGTDTLDSADALKDVFGYSNAVKGYNSGSTIAVANLAKMINPNLDGALPVILGVTGAFGGHAIVCDGYGYDSGLLYHHLNMGWSGSVDDAWYNLPDIDSSTPFTSVYKAVYNTFTSGSGEILSGRITDTHSGDPISGVVVRAVGTSVQDTTDAEGIFSLVGLPSGASYDLEVLSGLKNYTAPTGISIGTSSDYGNDTGNSWGNDFTPARGFRGWCL